jgi:predicted nucleotidyltransferase component of viral defense system
MKAYLREVVDAAPSPLAARNRVREYMQVRILESLQREGAMIPLAFHGGTALRFLYALSRYSEDLDCLGFSMSWVCLRFGTRRWR